MDEEQNSKRRENGVKRAGNGGVVPPVEHQFKPGNQAAVGHRNGKGPQLLAGLNRIMCEAEPADKDSRERGIIAAISLYQQAIKGNPMAIRQLWGRLCGPIPTVLQGGDPEKPILIADAKEKLLARINSARTRIGDTGGDSEPE